MKEKKGTGIKDEKTGKWFCSEKCKAEYDNAVELHEKKLKSHKGGCCH